MVTMAKLHRWHWLALLFVLALLSSCGDEEKVLAPYLGSPPMSKITVESETLLPKITWLGGYVSVLGVNRDTVAALDTTLLWLIHTTGNDIHFPIKFNELPSGAVDLTTQYGGRHVNSLTEDNTYSFWVLKEDVWTQVSASKGKLLRLDQSAASGSVRVQGDTLFVSPMSHIQKTQAVDLYTNIRDVKLFGPLANISIQQSDTSNNPIVTWTMKQSGVTDPMISACGITLGQSYDPKRPVWEAWSEEVVGDKTVFGKKNLIPPPIVMGQQFSGTRVFTEYPQEGLERGTFYYFWIANKEWDGKNHNRAARYHGFVTFETW